MNISVEVTPSLLKFLDRMKSSGRYTSRSEVVRDALRRMRYNDLYTAFKRITPEEFERRKKIVGEQIVREEFPELL